MQHIKPLLKAEDFNVGTTFGKVANNNGGFNFLDIADDLYQKAGDKFFDLYNKPWLDAAIARGDDIVLATKPTKKLDLFAETGKLRDNNFAKEINYLVQKGQKPINLTDTEWSTINEWFK